MLISSVSPSAVQADLIDWSRNAQLKTQLEEPPRENSLEAGEEAVYSDLSQ